MEQSQILSTLQEKLGNTSFSAQTLTSYVENNMPAEGTEPDEAYWTRHTNILKSLQGQFNHDVALKVTKQANAKFEEFKKNYKPTPDPDPNPGDKGKKSEGNEEMDALKKQLEDLTKIVNDASNRATQKELIGKVKEAMKGQNATDAYVLEKTLQGKVLDGNKTIEELTKEMLTEYDKEYKACRGEGAAPRLGEGGGGGGKSKTDLRFEAKKRRLQAQQQKK